MTFRLQLLFIHSSYMYALVFNLHIVAHPPPHLDFIT